MRQGRDAGRLPTFLVLGAQKSGSSWLASLLGTHPDVHMAGEELHFFDRREAFERGLDYYASLFRGAGAALAVGEKTPSYLWTQADPRWPGADGIAERIHGALPGVRLIAVLRDPADRAVSAVNHLIHTGRLDPSGDLDRHFEPGAPHWRALWTRGLYAAQLAEFARVFGRDRLLVLIYEIDIVAGGASGLASACRHIGVDPDHRFTGLERRVNEFATPDWILGMAWRFPAAGRALRSFGTRLGGGRKYRPSAAAWERLRALYAGEVARLEDWLGRAVPWAR